MGKLNSRYFSMRDKKVYLMLILFVFLVFFGCTKSPSNKEPFVPESTDIVSSYKGIENVARLKDFIRNVRNEKEDQIRVVSYTKEGDPIISDISFNGESLEVERDTTLDKYGENTITNHHCKSISVMKDENNHDQYILTECSGFQRPYYLGTDKK